MERRTKIILGITVLLGGTVAALPVTHDELSWKCSSSKEKTKSYYKVFLAQAHGNKKDADARAPSNGMYGRDIVDLLKEGKIEAEASGSGIEKLKLELKLKVKVKDKITVRIPVGTYFVCSGSAQNMVTTREKTVVLDNDRRISIKLELEVACANKARAIPDSEDKFNIKRSPKQKELQKLMPVLEKANAGFAIRQAAVWIITDNANYYGLGTLIRRPGGRVIQEYECARAMQICQEAGIDIKKKSIWRDRNKIIKGLPAGRLKTWLQEEAKK